MSGNLKKQNKKRKGKKQKLAFAFSKHVLVHHCFCSVFFFFFFFLVLVFFFWFCFCFVFCFLFFFVWFFQYMPNCTNPKRNATLLAKKRMRLISFVYVAIKVDLHTYFLQIYSMLRTKPLKYNLITRSVLLYYSLYFFLSFVNTKPILGFLKLYEDR